ncbi:hypothetical protein KBB68_01160 [Candidatus Babeliales bacterium]|nr:hypothetical protein [Candidatus Babeliales bacterium]
MKNFKNLWTLTFLMMTTQCFSIEDEEQEYNPETSFYADDNEELEKNLHNHQAVGLKKTEETPLTVKPNWLTKQFDKVSNWSNKRTLSKMFTANAKNDSSSQEGILPTEGTKNMWKTLSTKDQQDLINEWSKNRKDAVQKELARDHKKYTNDLNAYESHDKKETFAEIEHTKEEIKKIDKKIATAQEKLNKNISNETKERTLKANIIRLKMLKNAYEETKQKALTSIDKELKLKNSTHEDSKNSIIANHVTKINNFVNSINALEDSTVEISKNDSDRNKTQLLEESTDQLDLAKEPKIQERVTINENEPALTADKSEYNELAKKAKTIALSLLEFERIILLAKKVYGNDSFQYRIWDELYKTKLDEQLKSGEKLPLPKSAPTETSVNAKKNDDDFEEFLKGFTSQ